MALKAYSAKFITNSKVHNVKTSVITVPKFPLTGRYVRFKEKHCFGFGCLDEQVC